MTAATLAEHFPERDQVPVTGPKGFEPYPRYRFHEHSLPVLRCACGWVTDAPEALTAKRWAEHVLERTAA